MVRILFSAAKRIFDNKPLKIDGLEVGVDYLGE
jgi:hypothetical protein